MSEEHKMQNRIRNELAGECLLFRANVGKGWTGDVYKLPNGDILIKNPRPFDTGLPPGFTDTFGLVKELITAEMVGTYVGRFVAPEVKAAKGKATKLQLAFHAAVNNNGGRAGVVRSPEDARKLIWGLK
jgi:hypothetical protein